MRIKSSVVGLALAMGMAPGLAQAELLFGLTADNNIVTFNSATPGTVGSSYAITGLGMGEVLVGLDKRPATEGLYSVATSGNLYSLTLAGESYGASLVGNIGLTLAADGFGLDFNPVPDRLRLISTTDQNLRINPGNAATITDTPIGGGFDIVGSAYTNSRLGATSTTLYGLDAATDQLLRSSNPNGGVYFGVGSLGIPLAATDRVAFDISGATGAGFFNVGSSLYTVDLTTGAATLIGGLGSGELVGLTAYGVPEPGTWALMIGGFGLAGLALRTRRRTATA